MVNIEPEIGREEDIIPPKKNRQRNPSYYGNMLRRHHINQKHERRAKRRQNEILPKAYLPILYPRMIRIPVFYLRFNPHARRSMIRNKRYILRKSRLPFYYQRYRKHKITSPRKFERRQLKNKGERRLFSGVPAKIYQKVMPKFKQRVSRQRRMPFLYQRFITPNARRTMKSNQIPRNLKSKQLYKTRKKILFSPFKRKTLWPQDVLLYFEKQKKLDLEKKIKELERKDTTDKLKTVLFSILDDAIKLPNKIDRKSNDTGKKSHKTKEGRLIRKLDEFKKDLFSMLDSLDRLPWDHGKVSGTKPYQLMLD